MCCVSWIVMCSVLCVTRPAGSASQHGVMALMMAPAPQHHESFVAPSSSSSKPNLDDMLSSHVFIIPSILSKPSHGFSPGAAATPQFSKEPVTATTPSGDDLGIGRAPPQHDPKGRTPLYHDSEGRTPSQHDPEGRTPPYHDSEGRTPSQHDPEGRTPPQYDPQPRNNIWDEPLCVRHPSRCPSPAGHHPQEDVAWNPITPLSTLDRPPDMELEPPGRLLIRGASRTLRDQNNDISKSFQHVSSFDDSSPSTSWKSSCSETTNLVTCKEDTSFQQPLQGCGYHTPPRCNNSDTDLLKNTWNLENAPSLVPDLLKNSWNLENAPSLVPDLPKNTWNLENAPSLVPDLLKNTWNLENASPVVPDLLKNTWNLENASPVVPDLPKNTWNLENASSVVPDLLKNSWNLENASSVVPDDLMNTWNLENASSVVPDLLKNTWNLENASPVVPDLLKNTWNLENASPVVPDLLMNTWNLENASSVVPDDLMNTWNLENASYGLPYEATSRQNHLSSECFFLPNTSSSGEPLSGCIQKTSLGRPSGLPLMASEWGRIVGYSLIFLVGVVGNVLVVVTLLHHRNLRTVTNVFLLNLALSDLLLGVFCMPFTLVGSLLQDFIFGALMCRLIPYIQAVSVCVSVWTLVAISLERFYAICQPLRSRGWQTPAHSYKVIAGVWAASLCFMMPIATLSTLMPVKGDQGRYKCREVWPSLLLERIFTILLTTTLLLVPLLVMAAAYLKVIRALWLRAKLHRTGNKTQPGSREMSSGLKNCSSGSTSPTPSIIRTSTRFCRIRTISCEVVKYQCRAQGPSGSSSPSENPEHLREVLPFDSNLETRPTPSVETRGSLIERRGDPSPKGRRISKDSRWRIEDTGSCGVLRSSHTERSLQAKKRVIRMLFVLVAEFFICWTPLFIVNLLSLYVPRQVYAALGSFGVSLVQLLAYFSSCCNPLTYCFMNANFIQSFKQAFGCPRRRSSSSRTVNDSSFRCGTFCQVPPYNK